MKKRIREQFSAVGLDFQGLLLINLQFETLLRLLQDDVILNLKVDCMIYHEIKVKHT